MHLLGKLLEKNLEENYQKLPDDVVVNSFYHILYNGTHKEYHLTVRHLKSLQAFIKGKITRYINLDEEKFTVAGGSVLTLLMYASPFLIRDVDIFPCSMEDYNKLKAKFDLAAKTNKIDIYENGNSRSYKFGNGAIDLIKKCYETPQDCIAAFDIDVCKVAFEGHNNFYFHKRVDLDKLFDFRMNITAKITADNAYTIFRRAMKYSAKGFRLGKQDMMELFASIVTGADKNSTGEEHKLWKNKFEKTLEDHKNSYHTLVDSTTDFLEKGRSREDLF